MKTGTVKMFNTSRGFGFIKPDDSRPGEKDDFFHVSAIEKAGIGEVEEGDRLSYEMEVSKRTGKMQAVNVARVG